MSSPQVLFSNPQGLVSISTPERLVPSRFNVRRVLPNGDLILYNSFNGAYSIFPASIRPRLQSLLSARGSVIGADMKLQTYLRERGYLVAEGTNEINRVRMLNGRTQYRTDNMELILLASEECNFRCTYCYETFPRGTMEPWVRQAVVKWVGSRIERLGRLNIEWFGGEPLLGIDAIRDIAPALKTMAAEHGVQFSQAMTTNGYLLTRDTVSDLLAWGINSFQITLDGIAKTHNTTRVLKEGGDTYDQILCNLLAMRDRPEPFEVKLRVNFGPDNIGALRQYIAEMSSHFGGDPRFTMRFYPVGKWGGTNDDNVSICGHGAFDVHRELEIASLMEGLPTETRKEWLQPQNDLVICYAARPFNFIVGADGKLMKCTLVLEKADYNVVGSLSSNGVPNVDLDKMAKWVAPYFEDDVQCQKCFFLPSCQGCSCPLMRIEHNQRPCPPEKDQIGKTLESVWSADQLRLTKLRPEVVNDLSHLLA